MPNPAHRPSQRSSLLEAALAHLRGGGTLSLESAARAAGVSKPGLMYHFQTKEALVAALVDHLVAGYERDLRALLATPLAEASASDRLAAYVRWSLTAEHDAADLVMLSDPKLRVQMTARWTDQLRTWTDVPAGLSEGDRARLNAARLIADGCWFADASGVLPIPQGDRPALLATALSLLEGADA